MMAQPSILLIDDADSDIRMISAQLENCCRVRFAQNEKDALRLIQDEAPDLVLLDMELGKQNGLRLLSDLRETLGSEVQLPFVMITSHNDPFIMPEAYEMGALGVITKPPCPEILPLQVKAYARLARKLARRNTSKQILFISNHLESSTPLATALGLEGYLLTGLSDELLSSPEIVALANERFCFVLAYFSGKTEERLPEMIAQIQSKTDLPICAFGCLQSDAHLQKLYQAGADLVIDLNEINILQAAHKVLGLVKSQTP